MSWILPPKASGLHQRFPSLRRSGLAVEYFPRYVNRTEEQHSLDVVLLSVIVRGRGRHVMGDEVHRESGGSVAVTHYGQMHDIVTDARGMDIYNVYLDLRNHPLPVLPESLRPILSAILPIHPRLAHLLNRRVWVRIDDPARLAASLGRIEAEMNSARPGALEIVQHCFQVFLIDLCRAAQSRGFVPFTAPSRNIPAWVEKLRQEIDLHYARPHDLASLAKRIGVSVAYLCRLFKAYTGKTVIAYLVERRIQAAMWALRGEDDKIIAMAMACGFNDLAYFNRAFRRIAGTTPTGYRKRFRKPVRR
jgi:AraC-like DNA-binding protein